MIMQYLEIKEKHKDAILFFRLGDFYEMFFNDAEIAARELEIVLTARDGGSEKVPMCGIPYHSAGNYIAKLINRGYKIAICEQVEDPKNAKGIVKREVIKIITPGTVLDDSILEENNNNYLAAVVEEKNFIGFSYIDISTGDFWVTEIWGDDAAIKLESELQRISPAECLVPAWHCFSSSWQEKLQNSSKTVMTAADVNLNRDQAEKLLLQQFGVSSLEGLGLKDFSVGIKAAAAIISFLDETQKTNLKHIRKLQPYNIEHYLDMDFTTRRNLELTSTVRDGRREGSLLAVLDFCCTAMGKRNLRKWIEQPLRNIEEINQRLDTVGELKENLALRAEIKPKLSRVYDLERLAGKIGSGLATPRDLLALKISIGVLEDIARLLREYCRTHILRHLANMDLLKDLYCVIDESIDEEAPVNLKEGGIIKKGYSQEIDELRELSQQGSDWLVGFEQKERERTGIKSLKVGFNKVFGYYIEISRSNLHLVPGDYHRKQTLANAERFISEELKNYENRILGAREKLFSLEQEEFAKIREKIGGFIDRIQNTAMKIAELDVLYSLAEAAYLNDYVRPQVDKSGTIKIKGGRHPVVEKFLKDSRFVPNDLNMDTTVSRFIIITGPNMGGKSTFMRQTALLVIMAQMGSFIPADEAHIGIVDKIFTRVGAADDLAAGQSTFMVEMVEVANILNNATENSLILLDEIGRGTSTYDGFSIAQAVCEFIYEKIKAKTLFATHYHELTGLGEKAEGIVNLSVSVKETGDTVIFLKKVLPGKADKSYGLHVAKLAGIPENIISRAEAILAGMEERRTKEPQKDVVQLSLFMEDNPVLEELKRINPDELTPRDALMYVYRWKEISNNKYKGVDLYVDRDRCRRNLY